MHRTQQDIENSFWKRVDKTNKCWLWKGGKYGGGYGKFDYSDKEREWTAHRYSYCLANKCTRESIKGWMICHHCDVKLCVKPDHLYKGTAQTNSRDAVERNRIQPKCLRGTDIHTAKLTEEDVREIRRLYARGFSKMELARKYGLNEKATQIFKIVNGLSWKHVT